MAGYGTARARGNAAGRGISHARAAAPHIAQNSEACIRVVLTGSHAASACGLTVDLGSRRRGSPICKLARLLVDAGHGPRAMVRVYRNDTLCFQPMPLARWAGLTTSERDGESIRFERWRPLTPATRAVPPKNGLPDHSREIMPASGPGDPDAYRDGGVARHD